ncbi:hypothetical protein EAS54_35435 [Bradyrhizobium guangzhouense]|nr:hypothetical protein EAS54_35435 [Bradyrhizobium guangzhouense]
MHEALVKRTSLPKVRLPVFTHEDGFEERELMSSSFLARALTDRSGLFAAVCNAGIGHRSRDAEHDVCRRG